MSLVEFIGRVTIFIGLMYVTGRAAKLTYAWVVRTVQQRIEKAERLPPD